MHLNGKKNRKMSCNGRKLARNEENGQKIYAYENIFGPGVVCPCPGAIYM